MLAQEISDYKNILKDCFQADPDLLEKWHIKSNSGLDACVAKTFDDLKNCDLKFYQITQNDALVGYFGKEKYLDNVFLTGFFIKPEYRNSEIKTEFWSLLKKNFNSEIIYCGLYKKNIPAINFIQKHGANLVKDMTTPDGDVCLFEIRG